MKKYIKLADTDTYINIKVCRRMLNHAKCRSYWNLILKYACNKQQNIKEKKLFRKYYQLGTYYGYPQCCIKSFCELPIEDRTEAQKEFGGKGFGFIPCPKHALELQEGKITTKELLKGRKAEFPLEKTVL